MVGLDFDWMVTMTDADVRHNILNCINYCSTLPVYMHLPCLDLWF